MALNYLLKELNEKFLFPLRFNSLAIILSDYLQGNNNVLDLGSSCGRLSKAIHDKTGINFIGIDVHQQPKSFIPVFKYDGKNIPFDDKSFDCVMIIDAIHHLDNVDEIINEAKRVTRRFILIKDHYWINKFDFLILKIYDYIGNKPYGVRLTNNFLSLYLWKELFKRNKLKLVEVRKFKFKKFEPVKHIIFKLEI